MRAKSSRTNCRSGAESKIHALAYPSSSANTVRSAKSGPGGSPEDYRANVNIGRSRVGQFIARHIARHTDPYLFRLTRGRVNMGVIINAPLLSTGAKSGQRRETQLTYFHDGPDVILIASNYGGTKHPQQYHTLGANSDCEFGGESVTASEITGSDEYARLYQLAERVYAGYGDYRAKTEPVGREIPILRLKPRERPWQASFVRLGSRDRDDSVRLACLVMPGTVSARSGRLLAKTRRAR